MDGVTKKTIADFEFYQGEHAIAGIRFRYAGKNLGVSAWGMNVIDMDPNCTKYPEHDHTKDKQEEVYVILEGHATLHVHDETIAMKQGDFVRIAPDVKRKFTTSESPAKILALGATPGEAYKPR
jgi:mannose-6-phosphate isomerase-like protein (cupin superfamily)